MSELGDNDGKRGWSAMLNSEIDEQDSGNERKSDLRVSDFIRYSDSVDERMLGMVNRRKEASEINFNSWDRRGDFHELSSESEEESPLASTPRRYSFSKERKGDTENGTRSDSSMAETNSFERQYQKQNMEVLASERICPSETQELVKKFRTIKLLREKENSKQVHENEEQKPNFSTQRAWKEEEEESEQETNLEEFFGLKSLGRKRIDIWKGKDNVSETSDGSLSGEEWNKDIDDLVELLSSTSLIKIYDENLALPKEEEILNTFLQSEEKENSLKREYKIRQKKTVEYFNDLFENVPETTTQETSKVHLDDESYWKPGVSEERDATLNGYDVDNQSSFHDWVLHEIFSKSPDPELTLCSKCVSVHGSALECSLE